MKAFMFFVNSVFWLWLFVVPTGVLGFFALWLYVKSPDNSNFSVAISIAGVILGIVLAEFVRRRYGLDNFFGALRATPDIDEGNMLDQKE